MKLLFAYDIDEPIQNKLDIIRNYTAAIEESAVTHKHILGLEFIEIKLIIQELIKGYEDFIKPRKPKFRKQYVEKNPIAGDTAYSGYLTFELLFQQSAYEALINSDSESALKEILKHELLRSKGILQDVQHKLGDIAEFDKLIIKALS